MGCWNAGDIAVLLMAAVVCSFPIIVFGGIMLVEIIEALKSCRGR